MVCAGELRPDQFEAGGRVDELLTTMSDEQMAKLWTVAALRSDPRWQAVRELAERALALFP